MREVPVSKCEYDFVRKCIGEGKRIDGRDLQGVRQIKISYKLDYGYCTVSMGETKVLAQVKAEMDRPKESRSNEGNLGIFVEMSTMASPAFDPTKPGELGVELQRMLERSILFSKAIDLEELCVRVGEKSWNISLHLHIISHDGNILDCASIAAFAALAHFNRPDVTVVGKEVQIHTLEEKSPVSLIFNHQPFCVTFAFFDNGTISMLDPTKLEENCADGKLMIAMNKHREVCCTQMSGIVQVNSEQVLKCVNMASKHVKELTELVKKSISNDNEAKRKGLKASETTSAFLVSQNMEFDPKVNTATVENKIMVAIPSEKETVADDKDVPVEGQKLSWIMKTGDNTYTAGEDAVGEVVKKSDNQEMDTDEEEETTVTMQLS